MGVGQSLKNPSCGIQVTFTPRWGSLSVLMADCPGQGHRVPWFLVSGASVRSGALVSSYYSCSHKKLTVAFLSTSSFAIPFVLH